MPTPKLDEWMQHINQRLDILERTPQNGYSATAQAHVEEFDGISATTYSDLTTPGPEFEVSVGPSGVLVVHLEMQGVSAVGDSVLASFSVVGETNMVNPDDDRAIIMGDALMNPSGFILVEGLEPEFSTVTMKYRSGSGGNGLVLRRRLTVFPI